MAASLENGEISLEEINYATVDFYFKSNQYDRGRYKVDIVSLNSLAEYLDICNERLLDLEKEMKAIGLRKIQKN